MICRHRSKVDSCSNIAPFWDIPEGQRWKEIFPVGRTLISAPVVHLAWQEKGPVHELWPMVQLDGPWLGKNITGNLVTRKFGKRYVDRTLWVKTWRYFYPMWMFTQGWPQQKRILIIKWIRWPVLWLPVRLHLATPTITQRAYKQSGHGDRDGIIRGLSNMGLLFTKVRLAMATVECPICQQVRPTPSSTRRHSLGWPARYLKAGWLHGTASILERAVTYSHWSRHLPRIGIFLPCTHCLCQNYHLWTHKML